MEKQKRVAIFASGSGTNFEALATLAEQGQLPIKVVLMVCDQPQAYVIERAKQHNIEALVLSPKTFTNKAAYEQTIVDKLQSLQVDFICLAGYMRIVSDTLLNAFPQRIINIHPALLPSFKGAHAIDDAFNFGVKVFGVTVHIIDQTVDGGTILAQRGFEYHGTSRDEVEAKIHEIEHVLYGEAVTLFCQTLDKQ
ncbi:MAG: phosphoribosylglycinamide formyltransferase [Bacteroidales bacterium]|nr:phosphoribosylglycinamide formyltransferase [Bacteroidales bacterium]